MPDRFRVYTSNVTGGASLIDDTKLSSVRFKELIGSGVTLTETDDSITLSLSAPTKPQVVATRCQAYDSSRVGYTSGRSDLRIENRHKHYAGGVGFSQIQLAQVGWYLKNDSTGEHLIGNDYTWEAAIEITSPATAQEFYTLGTSLVTVSNGIPLILTQPFSGVDIAAGGSFFIRQAVSIDTPAYTLPACSAAGVATDTGFISPAIVSQVNTTGAMTTPTGGTGFGGPYPALILGIPTAPMSSVCIIGDSISNGSGDTADTLGSVGFVARGLELVGSYPIPYGKQTVGSDLFSKNTLDTSPRKRALWPYFTHVVVALGTNDIAAATSLANMQTYVTNLATSIKNTVGPYGKPLKTAFCTIMPRTASTDSWATVANQTPVAGFTVGTGVRDLYNTWLKAQAGSALIDYVIDTCPYVESSPGSGAWIVTGSANYATTDGVHPSAAVHTLAAQAVNAWALTITP